MLVLGPATATQMCAASRADVAHSSAVACSVCSETAGICKRVFGTGELPAETNKIKQDDLRGKLFTARCLFTRGTARERGTYLHSPACAEKLVSTANCIRTSHRPRVTSLRLSFYSCNNQSTLLPRCLCPKKWAQFAHPELFRFRSEGVRAASARTYCRRVLLATTAKLLPPPTVSESMCEPHLEARHAGGDGILHQEAVGVVSRREQVEQLPVRLRQGAVGFDRVAFPS